jgi:hypothetical protein
MLTQLRDHLNLIPDGNIERMTSRIAMEIKNRIKVDVLHIATETHNDIYLCTCLAREKNLALKREQEKLTPGTVDLPSEELNTTWELFMPATDLDDLIKQLRESTLSGDSWSCMANVSDKTDLAQEGAKREHNVSWIRAKASESLEHLYLSRAETIRYRHSKGELRGVYYSMLALSMVTFAFSLIAMSFYEFVQGSIAPEGNILVFDLSGGKPYHILITVLLSGAIGSVLALMLRFRGLNRITEFRQAVGMLLAQVCTGSTAALILFLILRSGWIQVGLLDPSWYPAKVGPGTSGASVDITLPLAEVVLASFLAGFSETLFLNVLERTGSLIGGQPGSVSTRSPAP